MLRLILSSLIICIGLLLIKAEYTSAQTEDTKTILEGIVRGGGDLYAIPQTPKGIVGTPHFTEFMSPARIKLDTGTEIEDIPSRYNVYNDELEVIHQGDTLALDSKYLIEFTFLVPPQGYLTFKNRLGEVQGEFDEETYLQVLHEGKTGVYKRHMKKFREPEINRSGYEQVDPYYRFLDETQLYYKNEQDEFETLRLRRRDVLRLFGDHSREVRRYVSSHNLSYRDVDDFVKMVAYYETLIADNI